MFGKAASGEEKTLNQLILREYLMRSSLLAVTLVSLNLSLATAEEPLVEKYLPQGTEVQLTRLRDYKGRTAAIEPSLGARLTVGSATILWVSALPSDQARLVATGVPLSAHILKLVGIGTRWGLDPEFFRRVNPEIVILPAGSASHFARPTPVASS